MLYLWPVHRLLVHRFLWHKKNKVVYKPIFNEWTERTEYPVKLVHNLCMLLTNDLSIYARVGKREIIFLNLLKQIRENYIRSLILPLGKKFLAHNHGILISFLFPIVMTLVLCPRILCWLVKWLKKQFCGGIIVLFNL